MLQQRSCQANLHGKHGQLKYFQKRQNKFKCHVMLEGWDLLSLYNRNLKSLFYNTGFNFWKHWHLCFKPKLFYWARSAKTCWPKRHCFLNMMDAVKVNFSYLFSFLVLANISFVYITFIHVACPDLPRPVNAWQHLLLNFRLQCKRSHCKCQCKVLTTTFLIGI